MTSKAVERAISLLDVLSSRSYGLDRNQIRGRIPGYAQARSDAAFERMFERDKDVLRALGVELVSVREPQSSVGFIYRIKTSAALSVSFSPLDFVLLSHLSAAWEGTELDRLARSAMLKIGAQTGQKLSGQLEETVKFSDVAGLLECLEATAENKGISFTYESSAEEVRRVSCWGLGLRFGHWYLYGWDRGRRAERIFRLDRMRGIKILAAAPGRTQPEFSMSGALQRIGTRDIPRVATVALTGAGEPDILALPSYSAQESAQNAVLSARTHELTTEQLPAGIDPARQKAAAQAERKLRRALLEIHGAVRVDIAGDLRWRPLAAQRIRESASEQLTRTVLMLSLISDAGSMELRDIASFFDLSVSKVRADLDAVASSVEFGTLTVHIDGDQRVTVNGAEVLTGGAALTNAEAATLILAIELGQSTGNQLVLDRLTLKVLEAAPGQAALHTRFSVYARDTDEQIQEAIEQRIPLLLRYTSYRGESERTVEPLALVVSDGPRYLRAWCRASSAVRNFRLDRITGTQQLTAETFEPREENLGITPDHWMKNLEDQIHELVILAVPTYLERNTRESTERRLERYAIDSARTAELHLFRVPVVNETWLFELLVSLEGTASPVAPAHICTRIGDMLGVEGSVKPTK